MVDTVAECAKAGVKIVTILAAGFSETGADGVAREQRLREIAAETGIRIIGPSSLGVVNLREGLMLTANAAFAEPDIPVGRTFFASHSGTMIGALMSRGKARGVGFAGLVSIGNEVDLSVGEICAATLDDPDIDGYLLFLESIRNAAALRDFALGAAARGKPVVAYKLGRSSAARELAVTHTGALAGEDDVASAFLADCGIARVESLEGLIEALPLVRRTPIRPVGARPPRVAVLTTTAGGAIMVVDPLAMRGVEIAQPSAETYRALRREGHRRDARAHRRSDHRGHALRRVQGRARHSHHRARVRHGAGGGRLIGALPSRAGGAGRSSTARTPQSRSRRSSCPKRRRRWRMLSEAGIPSFRTPEACADAIAAALAPARAEAGSCGAAGGAAAACSMSLRPTRCSTGSACRARPRSRSRRRSRRRPPCPSRIRSP